LWSVIGESRSIVRYVVVFSLLKFSKLNLIINWISHYWLSHFSNS
jgi:hypothetical protein